MRPVQQRVKLTNMWGAMTNADWCSGGSGHARHADLLPQRIWTIHSWQLNMVRFPERRRAGMSIVDDLVSNLVERNAVKLNGAFTITLIDGGVAVKGQIFSTVRDQKKNKDLLNIRAPISATVKVAEIVIPLPQIR
jgi:hypothetical protein